SLSFAEDGAEGGAPARGEGLGDLDAEALEQEPELDERALDVDFGLTWAWTGDEDRTVFGTAGHEWISFGWSKEDPLRGMALRAHRGAPRRGERLDRIRLRRMRSVSVARHTAPGPSGVMEGGTGSQPFARLPQKGRRRGCGLNASGRCSTRGDHDPDCRRWQVRSMRA